MAELVDAGLENFTPRAYFFGLCGRFDVGEMKNLAIGY
jgi:hypothetical protein